MASGPPVKRLKQTCLSFESKVNRVQKLTGMCLCYELSELMVIVVTHTVIRRLLHALSTEVISHQVLKALGAVHKVCHAARSEGGGVQRGSEMCDS
jgi:hypothetical protein